MWGFAVANIAFLCRPIGIEARSKTRGGRDALCSLPDINDQPGWAIGWLESACDEVFYIAAVLVAAIPADKQYAASESYEYVSQNF